MEGGGIYFFVPPFFCVWPIFMPYFFVWQIKIFSTVAWQNVRAANRTKNFEKGQQKRKSLRKKKKLWGPLEKYFQNCNSAKRTKPNVNLENECMARSIRQMLDAQQKPFAHAFSQSARAVMTS